MFGLISSLLRARPVFLTRNRLCPLEMLVATFAATACFFTELSQALPFVLGGKGAHTGDAVAAEQKKFAVVLLGSGPGHTRVGGMVR